MIGYLLHMQPQRHISNNDILVHMSNDITPTHSLSINIYYAQV